MQIHHIRNATMILVLGENHILVDPMLAPRGALPSYRWLVRKRRKNPTVNMPRGTTKLLSRVNHALITHCQMGHLDHLDPVGIHFLRQRNIPVYCSEQDEKYLRKYGMSVHPLQTGHEQPFLQSKTITPVPCRHGRGWISKFMANGVGYIIRYPNRPVIYIAGDTVLTPEVRRTIEHHGPEIVVLPAGGARLDVGKSLMFTLDEIVEAVKLCPGRVILNHLEALDHCRVMREDVQRYMEKAGVADKVVIPQDGELLDF